MTDNNESEVRLYRSLAKVLASKLDLHELARETASLVVEAVNASVCFVHLVDHEQAHLRMIGATPPFDELRDRIQLGLGDGVSGWVAQTGQSAVVPDKWKDHRYRYIPELKGERFESLVSVPLVASNGQTVGVLNVHWEKAQDDLSGSTKLLENVAQFISGAFENAELLERISEKEQSMRNFAAQLIEAHEQERRRLLLDLHDGVLQQVHGALYRIDALRAANDEERKQELDILKGLLRDVAKELRQLVDDPGRRVLDDFGLSEAIESLASTYRDFEVMLEFNLPDGLEIDHPKALAIFRIAQEALNNARKHSNVNSCELRLAVVGSEVVLAVRDRGAGFDVDAKDFSPGVGLAGMKERARILGGRVELFSRPGEGTLVRASIPLDD